MTKLTYVNAINAALRALNGEEIENKVEVAEKLIALGQSLEKRNASKSGKPTKKQGENAEVKHQILEWLWSADLPMKCGEIAESVHISGQKCSALLAQLVKEGEVIKTVEKRVAYFTAKPDSYEDEDEDDPVQALPGELSV